MYISRIVVRNFRNFKELDVATGPGIVIVGENQVGKSNLVHALRLVLDPNLGDNARRLRIEDFWDGLPRPLDSDDEIEISVEVTGFQNLDEEALLADCLVQGEPLVARITYLFRAKEGVENPKQSGDYEPLIFGGDRPHEAFDYFQRSRMPMEVVQASRNAPTELQQWHRNPLRPLLEDAAGNVDVDDLAGIVEGIQASTDRLLALGAVRDVSDSIRSRVLDAVGIHHSSDYSLGLGPVEAQKLLRALRIFFDAGQRGMAEASDGASNLVYLILKAMYVETDTILGNRDHTFLAIEEPDAFLHPHLQRLAYRRFLRDRFQAQGETPAKTSAIITTHSPHVASVAPLRSIVYIRKDGESGSSAGVSLAGIDIDEKDEKDIERFLDATRSELVFARATILVEGPSERVLIPRLARDLERDLDRNGVSVVSINGTHFGPYARVVGPQGLQKPVAVVTDGDPGRRVTGERRAAALIPILDESDPPDVDDPGAIRQAARGAGIFVGDQTFEVDLWNAGNQESMRNALLELLPNGPRKEEVNVWPGDGHDVDADRVLELIDDIGKARFAQRLAATQDSLTCPHYVQAAVEWVTEETVADDNA